MFSITLITMGKLKEKFYISAAEEYKKRLGGYCALPFSSCRKHGFPKIPPPARSRRGWKRKPS